MMENDIRRSVKTIYGMLWTVLALYEKTECYNEVPENETADDILEFMGGKLDEIRKKIDTEFLGHAKLRATMNKVVDETEVFVRSCERPGVVMRWKQINPQILFFDCAFELMEKCPELFREISRGLTNVKLTCYPDEALIEARNKYFADTKKKIEMGNLRYSEERVFQDELLRTLTLIFENDFKDYL